MAAVKQMEQSEPRRLRSLRPDAPAELERILAELMNRDPKRRPPTALSVMRALEPFADAT
jgi:hypothetical protein